MKLTSESKKRVRIMVQQIDDKGVAMRGKTKSFQVHDTSVGEVEKFIKEAINKS